MFYAQFEQLCREKHIKPATLARKLGFSPSAPGRWKKGSVPQSATLQRLSDYFGVTPDFLLSGEDRRTINTMGNVTGSAVVQGNSGSNVSVSNSHREDGTEGGQIVGFEAELLRVFRNLDMKGKAELLHTAYELETSKND